MKINGNNLDVKLDMMKHQLQKNISRKIQLRLTEERAENALINLMFQHLKPQELLDYSLVSKKWYQEIGKLKTFRDRIKLKCPKNDFDVVEESERYYRKIEITVGNEFWDMQEAERVILKNSPHLRAIKIVKFGGFNAMLNEPLPFSKKLSEVELHVVCGRLNGQFLKYIETLKKLTVNGLDPQGLLCCLANNSNLKELTLYENSFISYFENDFSSLIKFKLNKFALYDHLSTGLQLEGESESRKYTLEMLKNLIKFLRTQKELKSLHLDSCHAANLGKFIKPSIEILEVNKLNGSAEELKIPESNNIRVLLTNFTSIKFFSKFKKLEIIFVRNLTSDALFVNNQVKNIYYETKEDETLEWINEDLTIEQMSKDEFMKIYCNKI